MGYPNFLYFRILIFAHIQDQMVKMHLHLYKYFHKARWLRKWLMGNWINSTEHSTKVENVKQ